MALEDFIEPEVGVAVALTALVASPKVRSVLRRGAVYGLAGLLTAGDAASSLVQGVKRGAQKATPVEGVEAETPAVPEVLSMDPDAPVGHTVTVPDDGPAEAPAAPKRARKTTEAASHE